MDTVRTSAQCTPEWQACRWGGAKVTAVTPAGYPVARGPRLDAGDFSQPGS